MQCVLVPRERVAGAMFFLVWESFMRVSIRSAAAALMLSLPVIPVASAQSLTSPIVVGNVTIKLQSVASISTATAGEPLDFAQPVGDLSRDFVATHGGQIRLIKNNSLLPTPFADIKAALAAASITLQGGTGSDERGLIGMAFHPDFNVPGAAGNGKFFTYTSESIQGTATFTHPEFTPTGAGSIGYNNVLREWSTTPTSDTLTNLTSRVIFKVNKSGSSSETNHNGGGLKFGPNKYLYLSVGDGGGGNDFNGKDSNTDGHTNVTGNGQDNTVIYGKIVRVDPLNPSSTPASTDPISSNGAYRVPASNPFAGATAGLDEVFLMGMRNPFRFSFDRGNPNEMYVGDVGQSAREEVDLIHVSSITGSNNNFGWPFLEGTADNSNYAQSGAGTVAPIAEYTHSDGISIQGGFVYRGTAIPQLTGKYVFGDLGSSNARLFYMDAAGGTISELQYGSGGAPLTGRMDSLGEDQAGNIFALMANGNIIQLIPEPASLGAIAALWGLMRRRR
jgi:glucose/arabinose dehydrogenase